MYFFLEKPISEVSFFGNEWLGYDLMNITTGSLLDNIVDSSGIWSRREQLSLYFKTSQPNGLLFVAGDDKV